MIRATLIQQLQALLRLTTPIFLSFIVFMSSCGSEKEPIKIDPAFSAYVVAVTSGVISNESEIRVRLAASQTGIAPLQTIEEPLFKFSPKLEGQTYWEDDRTIVFKPANRLPAGKVFDVDFALGKVMEVSSNLSNMEFGFQVMRQHITVAFEGMEAVVEDQLRWQRLSGTLSTSDNADEAQVEQVLRATQSGRALKLIWDHSTEASHTFLIDSVERLNDASKVYLEWDGAHIESDDEDELVIEIPSISDFKLMAVRAEQEPQQHIVIVFSDPLDSKQDLRGLISLAPSNRFTFQIDRNTLKIYPSGRLTGDITLVADAAIRNIAGFALDEKFEQTLAFTSINPEIQLLGDGVILPSSDGLIFPFRSVNLKAVQVRIIKIFEKNIPYFLQVNQLDGNRDLKRVGRLVYKNDVKISSEKAIDYGKWNNFSLDLSSMIKTEPGAIYRVQLSFRQDQSLFPCGAEQNNEQELDTQFGEDPEFASYDNPKTGYYDYYDDYNRYYYDDEWNYNEKNDPCKKSYYLQHGHGLSRNFIASDLGLIAKRDAGNRITTFVTDLIDCKPKSGVNIEVYNYQNQLIGKSTTDGDGIASIEAGSKPFLIVAKEGSERGYLRVDDGNSLSVSMFDVTGAKSKDGVKGMIYGERGVWRPGDSIFLTFILEDKLKMIPDDHPVVFELYTPENQLYQKKVSRSPVHQFYDFRTATQQESPTGNWLAKIKVGGSTFTKTLKVEAIKPNRLKLNLDFGNDVISAAEETDGMLNVKWLHGAVAKNLKADVDVILRGGQTKFKEYPGYTFDDPSKRFETQELTIFDGQLDESGQALVEPRFNISSPPGMINAYFKVRAFEQGGDFSIDRFMVPYSSYDTYVGVKVPEGPGWRGAIYSNEPNLIPIVTVDEKGKPVDKDLEVQIYSIRWRWWWDDDDDYSLRNFMSSSYGTLLSSGKVSTVNGKAIYEMDLQQESWGRKVIRVYDPASGHSTGQTFYTSYKGYWSDPSAEKPGGAEMLNFTLEKEKYEVGDEVVVNLPESETGRALVSIESGSKIINTMWVDLAGSGNKVTFDATEEMAPNVYVNVALIQPHNQTRNDRPIRMYGIQRVLIENKKNLLSPVISMPDELRPLQQFEIKVSEKEGRKMTYTLAMVDDGLLDLTRFKTPDPYNHFYSKEALEVRTWDNYQYVMGALEGEMAGLLALGGDEYADEEGKKKANRFKPVVKFLGPFEMAAAGSKTHKITMPNYVGSVRVMLVAGQDGAYGNAQKTIPVKQPLMVLGSLPRVLGPTEKVLLPVTLFVMDEKIKSVNVKLETNELITSSGSSSQTISIKEVGEQMVYFELDVAKKIGIGRVTIYAKSGNESSSFPIELDVRLPNPRITEVTSAVVQPGESWSNPFAMVGMAGTNNGFVEVSTVPPIRLRSRLQYLIRYPHGCIEQTTSSVFPQLFVGQLLELPTEKKNEISSNIQAGIERLKNFQLNNGGLSYWPGNDDGASDWGTNYAGHFMLEAQAQGYNLPSGFLTNWIKYQKRAADEWTAGSEGTRRHYYNSGQLIQAYRLYTLAMAGKPSIGAMNKMRELNNLTAAAKWRLAAAYFLAGKHDVAKQLINAVPTSVDEYKEMSYSYGSATRDQSMILEALVLIGDQNSGKGVMEDICKRFDSDRWYSTQTTAYTLMALSKFIGTIKDGASGSYQLSGSHVKDGDYRMLTPIKQVEMAMGKATEGDVSLKNTGDKTLFVKVIMDGIPLIGDNTKRASNLNMQLSYTDMAGKTIDPGALEQGTDFIAVVSVSHPGIKDDYKEMALTQIFPSGWEIINTRMDETESTKLGDKPTYQDIRDDRSYIYFDMNRGTSRTYKVLLNASFVGKYYLPSTACSAMYDNEISASDGGRWVEVVKANDPDS